jgi:hypothetical protein
MARNDTVICNFSTSIQPSKVREKRKSYLCNRPWRPIGLWEVEVPTFSRQSAYRWQWGCQPQAPAGCLLLPRKIPDTHFCLRLSRPQGHNVARRVRSIEKSNDLSCCQTIITRLYSAEVIYIHRWFFLLLYSVSVHKVIMVRWLCDK